MTESHSIGSPQQRLLEIADEVCEYFFGGELEDFLQTVSDNDWNLDSSRSHILYRLCELEWHLRPHLGVNPDRHFLQALADNVRGEDYERLDPSLKINA
jgi:hypothetical protein